MLAFYVVLPILLAGCAYNAPLQPASIRNYSVVAMPIETAWVRTFNALSNSGAMITSADRSQGLISTGKQTIRLTETEADCGNLWGIPYLKDSRTMTDVTYAVRLQDEGPSTRITVNTRIEGTFNAVASEHTKRLSCFSLGALERQLIDQISQQHSP